MIFFVLFPPFTSLSLFQARQHSTSSLSCIPSSPVTSPVRKHSRRFSFSTPTITTKASTGGCDDSLLLSSRERFFLTLSCFPLKGIWSFFPYLLMSVQTSCLRKVQTTFPLRTHPKEPPPSCPKPRSSLCWSTLQTGPTAGTRYNINQLLIENQINLPIRVNVAFLQ